MRKTILLLLVLFIIAPVIKAQEEAKAVATAIQVATTVEATEPAATAAVDKKVSPWTHKTVVGVNMSQASYSYWAPGGDPSIAFDALLNMDLVYKKEKQLWTNRIELAYGLNRTSSNGTRKTNDKIYLNSNYGYGVAKNLYAGAMLTFSTQFDKGYNYVATPQPTDNDYISKLMAPGYLTIGAGLIWTPEKWFKLTYSPTSWRSTFVFDDNLSAAGAYGVEPNKNILNQFGSNLIAEVKTNLLENVSLYSRLELYSNYLKKPQNVMINWDTQITMKVNKWISASLNFSMLYDDNITFKDENGNNIGPKLQIKEVLGIGFQATF